MPDQKISQLNSVVTPLGTDVFPVVQAADINVETKKESLSQIQIFVLTDGVVTGTITVPNTGLHILDTNASHDLIIAAGSNLTADRTLTITTGDADRTVTLSGNPTLSDWFDQSVKVAASPTHAGLTVSGLTASQAVVTDGSKALASLAYDQAYTPNTLVQRDISGRIRGTSLIVQSNAVGDMQFIVAEAMTADRDLNIRLNDATRTLQIFGNATISQDYSVTGNPQFASLRLAYAPSYYLDISVVDSAMANRTLGLSMGDQNRLIILQGDLTFGGAFTTSGNFAVTQTYTGATNVTFPTSGTLATIAGGSTITDDTATNATMYPVWVTANTGTLPFYVSSTKLSFNPAIGNLTVSSGSINMNASNLLSSGGTNNFLIGTGALDILNIQVYDVDNALYRTFAVMSAANTPSVAWSQPAGGTLTWDGGAIGSVTPASGAFTTLSATTPVGLSSGGTNTATPQNTFTTTTVTGASQALAVNTRYIVNSASTPCTMSLPASSTVGDIIEIIGIHATGTIQITQGASQLIRVGSAVTTTGAGGTLTSTAATYPSIVLIAIVANTTWSVLGGPQSSWTTA